MFSRVRNLYREPPPKMFPPLSLEVFSRIEELKNSAEGIAPESAVFLQVSLALSNIDAVQFAGVLWNAPVSQM